MKLILLISLFMYGYLHLFQHAPSRVHGYEIIGRQTVNASTGCDSTGTRCTYQTRQTLTVMCSNADMINFLDSSFPTGVSAPIEIVSGGYTYLVNIECNAPVYPYKLTDLGSVPARSGVFNAVICQENSAPWESVAAQNFNNLTSLSPTARRLLEAQVVISANLTNLDGINFATANVSDCQSRFGSVGTVNTNYGGGTQNTLLQDFLQALGGQVTT